MTYKHLIRKLPCAIKTYQQLYGETICSKHCKQIVCVHLDSKNGAYSDRMSWLKTGDEYIIPACMYGNEPYLYPDKLRKYAPQLLGITKSLIRQWLIDKGGCIGGKGISNSLAEVLEKYKICTLDELKEWKVLI